MKRLMISAFFLGMLSISCSSDDNDNTPNEPVDTPSANIFLPLDTNNYWNYDVEGGGLTTRDSLYISNDSLIDGLSYKAMRTFIPPAGFFSGSVKNNYVRKDNSSILMWGDFNLAFPGIDPINLTLDDFVVFRENAADGALLSSVSDQQSQEIQAYPITAQYTLKSTAGANYPTYTTPGGMTYTDVKVVKVVMTLNVFSSTVVSGVPVTIPILETQDVVTSIQYFAKNIGMVYAATTFSYDLSDLSGFGLTLPIPESMNEIRTEALDTYDVEQ